MNDRQAKAMDKRVKKLIANKVPRNLWTNGELNWEAYEINGNVMGSGSDLPGTARPKIL